MELHTLKPTFGSRKENPRLGKRLNNGFCPPSKPKRTVLLFV